MIKVGLIVTLEGGWQGGATYCLNLLRSYQQFPDPDVKLIVFTRRLEELAEYRCDAIEVHSWPQAPKRSVWTIPRRAIRKYAGIDPALVGMLKIQRVDLLSHVLWHDLNLLGEKARIRPLIWMPDFQHRHLPGFFSQEECATRDSFIARSERYGHLLLSSRSAEADFRRFYPNLSAVQAHVLRFSRASVANLSPLSREELEARFPVHDPFFFLPNQFWQHKNHSVVVDALKKTPKEVRVICTGLMEDYRSPTYVPALLEKVRDAGLENRFICLGTVPFEILVSLMHYSIAIVQPSLFEGWSTTVEESKAMCKRVILSNIDVHLEQAPERAMYFSPKSPEELAECLIRAYVEFDEATEESFARQRQQLKTQVEREWVTEFARIVKNVCRNSKDNV
jgi:glycosyltransferase involved in cell wall biosynthesis